MSTRSAVAVPYGNSWRGRYVHSDGYPSHLLVALLTLIQRDGKATVLRKITEDRYGWSNLDPRQPSIEGVEIAPDADYRTYPYGSAEYEAWDLTRGMRSDGRFVNEPGYGIAYTTVQNQSAEDEWVTPENDWGTEWAYVVGMDSIAVLENQYSAGWLVRGHVPFDTPLDDPLIAQVEQDLVGEAMGE